MKTSKCTVRQHVLHGYALGLAHAVSAVLGLKMIGRNPIEVLEDHVGCGRQRDTDAAGDDVADRDPNLRVVLEAIDGIHALLGIIRTRRS